MKKIFNYLFSLVYAIDKFILDKFNKSVILHFMEFLNKNSYKELQINNRNINFFIPNNLANWRINTFFTQEPDTLKWIDDFEANNDIIFWDIGANIGLYSLYAATKHQNINIISFEPSTSNLRVLSRNISVNDLNNKIKICQFPLTNETNKFLQMNESDFLEGSSLHSFGEKINHEGKIFSPKNKYSIYGTSADYLLEQNILQFPNYVKIDVDGLEHFVLQGARKVLNSDHIKSVLVEVNENFTVQSNEVDKIMNFYNFTLRQKEQLSLEKLSKQFEKTFNYIYDKK